jgi:hypothetical protein
MKLSSRILTQVAFAAVAGLAVYASANSKMEVVADAEEYCLTCEEVENEGCNDWVYHVATVELINDDDSGQGSHSFCVWGSCFEKHPPCGKPGAMPVLTAMGLVEESVERGSLLDWCP